MPTFMTEQRQAAGTTTMQNHAEWLQWTTACGTGDTTTLHAISVKQGVKPFAIPSDGPAPAVKQTAAGRRRRSRTGPRRRTRPREPAAPPAADKPSGCGACQWAKLPDSQQTNACIRKRTGDRDDQKICDTKRRLNRRNNNAYGTAATIIADCETSTRAGHGWPLPYEPFPPVKSDHRMWAVRDDRRTECATASPGANA